METTTAAVPKLKLARNELITVAINLFFTAVILKGKTKTSEGKILCECKEPLIQPLIKENKLENNY